MSQDHDWEHEFGRITPKSYRKWAEDRGWDKDVSDLKPHLWLAYHFLFESPIARHQEWYAYLAATCILKRDRLGPMQAACDIVSQVKALREQGPMSELRFELLIEPLI
jgi:hypothetical protein